MGSRRIKTLPDWPRGLGADDAAVYIGLSRAAFDRAVASGTLPAPVVIGRDRLWDRQALDKALDRMSGAAVQGRGLSAVEW